MLPQKLINTIISMIIFSVLSLYTSCLIISCKENLNEKKNNELNKEKFVQSKEKIETTYANISTQNSDNFQKLNKNLFNYIGNINGDDIFTTTIKNLKNSPFDSVMLYFRNVTGQISEVDSLKVFNKMGEIQKIQPEFTLVSLGENFFQEYFIFDHYNADEFIDFKINTEASGNGMQIFQYYLYDRKSRKYEYSLPLSKTTNLIYDKKKDFYKSSANDGEAYSGVIFKLIGTEIKDIEKIKIEVIGKKKIVKYEKNGVVRLDTLPQEILNDHIEEFVHVVKSFWNFGLQ
jgi:hypothetical protein